jgi:16S rRNA (uracil1498-N3)-methyltransferase
VITLLIDPTHFDGDELPIEGDAYRHLFRARRLAAGDRLRLVDGNGRARWGKIRSVGRTTAAVTLLDPAPTNEPPRRVDLFVPTLRPETAAWLVEKATELGAAAIHFLNTDRAPRAFGDTTQARLRRVAAAAVEQCHRSLCPTIHEPRPLASVTTVAAGRRWLLDPEAPPGPPSSPQTLPGTPADALLVGPEGGWAPSEISTLAAAGWHRLALGPRILRIETAAIAGLALLLLSADPEPPKT